MHTVAEATATGTAATATATGTGTGTATAGTGTGTAGTAGTGTACRDDKVQKTNAKTRTMHLFHIIELKISKEKWNKIKFLQVTAIVTHSLTH